MSRPSSRHPTELELEILKIVWQRESVSVRDVRDALEGFRDLAYTSVMTVMNIMAKKGYLNRKKQGKSFVYEAALSEKETSRGMLSDLMERLFHGSSKALMLNLLEIGDIDQDEIEELRTLIERKAKEEKR